MITLPTAQTLSLPKLPSQLPLVNGSCGTGNCYLPPAEVSHAILQEYLHDYNSKIPLFAPESLYYLFRDCYAGAADERPLAWVLVYTTIAMTYRLRAMSVFAAPDDTEQAEWYLNVCLGRLPDLLVQPPCLRLVQACISIAWLLETSSRCERAPFFASTALRLATDLGYNDLKVSTPASVDELEKCYVFWLAFFIDSHFCVAEQRMGSLRLADINTPLPAADVSNWWNPTEINTRSQSDFNVFSLHCGLATIEAEAAENLFSVQARRQPTGELDAEARKLLDKLTTWRDSNALAHLDANDIARSLYRSEIVLCVVLEAAYFRTLYQLHSVRALNGYRERTDVFSPGALRLVMRAQHVSCSDDARRLLRLTAMMPQGNLSTTWYVSRLPMDECR